MKLTILFFCVILLLSCTTNKILAGNDRLTNEYQDQLVIPLELPNWFLNIPPNKGLAIGIAATNCFQPGVTDSTIKENASIIAARNKSAIVIAKLKMRENQENLTPSLVDFKLQLASDIPELKRYFEGAEIKNKVELYGMSIGLVGLALDTIETDKSSYISDKAPFWYTENAYLTPENYLLGSGKSSAINLSTAYSNAYNEAVYSLILGLKSDVNAALINSHNYTEKFVEIDASLIIENMCNTRNSIVLRRSSSAFIYDCFVELKWIPEYKVKELIIKD